MKPNLAAPKTSRSNPVLSHILGMATWLLCAGLVPSTASSVEPRVSEPPQKEKAEPAKAPKKEAGTPHKAEPRTNFPFHGVVSRVNVEQGTLTLKSSDPEKQRIYYFTPETRLEVAGAAGKWEDLAQDDKVTGQWRRDPAGRMELLSVKQKPKEEAPSAAPEPGVGPAKSEGTGSKEPAGPTSKSADKSRPGS